MAATVLAVELGGGLLSHSLALVADAGHIGADVLALGLAWIAAVQSRRPADDRRTYGYHRLAIIAALVNALLLVGVVAFIGVEAVRRLLRPEPVDAPVVIGTALLAIVLNGGIGWLLNRGDRSDVNIRAALLHVLGDLASAAGVVAAGVVILATGWTEADPLISLAIVLLIAWGAVRLARETSHVLLEGVPSGLELAAVERALLEAPRVRSVHDLHVWTVSPHHAALSAHLVVDAGSTADGEHLVRELESELCRRFGIGHTTIQLESCHPCAAEGVAHGTEDHNHPH